MASPLQFDQLISPRIAVIIAVVVILASLLIMTEFHGLLLVLKAVLLNRLSSGAAYGVLVVVFQWGRSRPLVEVHEKVLMEAHVPMVLVAAFGLPMDCDIFLLSRVKELGPHAQ